MQRPNFIFIQAEDTGCAQRCYGNRLAHTPHIDRLAAEGCRYSRAYATAPVCAPSRSSTVMGQTAFSQGSHHMRSLLAHPPRLYTHHLRDAGYYVNWANKTDFNFEPPEDFADDRHDWTDDLAAGRLPADRPFFLYTNLFVTHESTMWPGEYDRLVRPHLEPGQHCDPQAVPVPAYLPDTPVVRADIARHYDALAVQDQQVGRILEALERSGHAANTVVVYMGDHGRGLYREKRWCYDAGLRIPLILRAPGWVTPGSCSAEPVSVLDMAPTLLRLADIAIPERYHGRVLCGPEPHPAPEFVFAGRDRMDEQFDRVRAASSERYHYIRNDFPELPYASRIEYLEEQGTTREGRRLHAEGRLSPAGQLFFAETKPAEELYDTLADPNCVHNLADDPAHSNTLSRHRQALSGFLDRTGDLGRVPEARLIEEGRVSDILDDYRRRIQPLPKGQQIGPQPAPIEMPARP